MLPPHLSRRKSPPPPLFQSVLGRVGASDRVFQRDPPTESGGTARTLLAPSQGSLKDYTGVIEPLSGRNEDSKRYMFI